MISFLSTAVLADTLLQDAQREEHYSTFLRNLRNKALDFLKRKEIAYRVGEEDLRSQDFMTEADYDEDMDVTTYENISDIFDETFESLDKEFEYLMKEYDDENASDPEKVAAIKRLKAEATAKVNALIDRYHDKF